MVISAALRTTSSHGGQPRSRCVGKFVILLRLRASAAGMATPGGLKFLNDIQNRNVLQVQLAMRKGHANPNRNYLNVFPLNLAIEQVCVAGR